MTVKDDNRSEDRKMYRYRYIVICSILMTIIQIGLLIMWWRDHSEHAAMKLIQLAYFIYYVYAMYQFYLISQVRVYLDEEGIKRITQKKKEWKSISWNRIRSIHLGESSRIVKFCLWVRDEKENVAFSDWYADYIELSERIIEECQKRNPDAKIDPDVLKRLEQLKKEKVPGQNSRLDTVLSENAKAYRYRTSFIMKQLRLYVLAICVILILEFLPLSFGKSLELTVTSVVLILFFCRCSLYKNRKDRMGSDLCG